MGTIKKISFIMISLLIIHIIYFIFIRKIDNLRFEIYFKDKSIKEKLNYNYFFGTIPKKFNFEFQEQIIFEDKKIKLTNVLRKLYPNYYNYILYSDKKENVEFMLKNTDSLYYHLIDSTNMISSQFNIVILNKYLTKKGIKTKNNIIETFFLLSSTIGGDSSYETDYDPLPSFININSIEDYNLLIKGIDSILIKNSNDIRIFNPKKYDFNYSNLSTCWFKNHGLFQFEFEFENDTIVSVKDKFIGFTGAEKW